MANKIYITQSEKIQCSPTPSISAKGLNLICDSVFIVVCTLSFVQVGNLNVTLWYVKKQRKTVTNREKNIITNTFQFI